MTVARYAQDAPPSLNPERTAWLDLDGQEPKVDDKGRLTEAFVVRLYGSNGELLKAERFTVGCGLPCPPGLLPKKEVRKGEADDDRREDPEPRTTAKVEKRNVGRELVAADDARHKTRSGAAPKFDAATKSLYNRRWAEAKKLGPDALAAFKADWKAGRITQ